MGGDGIVLGLKIEVSWFKKFICIFFCLSSGFIGEVSFFWFFIIKFRNRKRGEDEESILEGSSGYRGGYGIRCVGRLSFESVFIVCGSLADFIIVVKVIIFVLFSRL